MDATVDPREVPGGGKLNPVNHIVRIVVVDPSAKSIAAAQSDSPDDQKKRVLKAAKKVLQKMPPPPPDPKSPTKAATRPTNMFQALKPTDIVVVRGKPASVLMINSAGKPVSAKLTREADRTASEPQRTRKLFAHDHHHTDTVLRVWTESDTIEYWCDQLFKIVEVKRAGWKIYDAPDNPFGIGNGKVDYTAQQKTVETGETLFVWKSGLLPSRANNQQYKMTFEIGGKKIDPDVACGDPPPR